MSVVPSFIFPVPLFPSLSLPDAAAAFDPQQCIRDVRVRRNIDHLSRMGDSSQRNRRRRRPTATAATDAKERKTTRAAREDGGEEEEVKPTRRRSVRPSPRQRARAGDFGLNERRSERRRTVHQRHQAGGLGWGKFRCPPRLSASVSSRVTSEKEREEGNGNASS